QPGDSGGPLVDGSGQIVGMDTASSEASGSNPIVSFAIPIIDAQGVAQQVQQGQTGGGVSLGVPGFLGVTTSAETAAGARVTGVLAGSPAARAGIVPGDFIVAIDGTPVDSYSPLLPIMQMYAPGSSIMISWTDPQGRSRTASAILQTGPAD
ncbi:MAG: S1C family serine protease, partial [Acidimicrobiales bacterium]